jgi:hypothetical protein
VLDGKNEPPIGAHVDRSETLNGQLWHP